MSSTTNVTVTPKDYPATIPSPMSRIIKLLNPREWKMIFYHKKVFCSMAEERTITVLDFFRKLLPQEQFSAVENVKAFNKLFKLLGGFKGLERFSEDDRFCVISNSISFCTLLESIGGINSFFEKLLVDEQKAAIKDPLDIYQVLKNPGCLEGLRPLPEKELHLKYLTDFWIIVEFLGGIEIFTSLPFTKRMEYIHDPDGFRGKIHKAVELLGGILSFRELLPDERIKFLRSKIASGEI